jgi:hypothetical protein
VVSIKLGTLVQDSQVHSGECTKCKGCDAVLSHYSKLTESEAVRVWACDFCGVENVVDLEDEELPTADTVDYILKPAPRVVTSAAESNVIFCVDTSGSMCVSTPVSGKHKFRGSKTETMQRELAAFNDDNSQQRMPSESRGVVYVSRLQAVQAAVDAQLHKLVDTHPNCRCGLVTFNSDVAMVGDGSKATATLAGDALGTGQSVRAAAQAHTDLLAEPVKSSVELLSKKLFGLEEGGQTALGPAVCASVSSLAAAFGLYSHSPWYLAGVGATSVLTPVDPARPHSRSSLRHRRRVLALLCAPTVWPTLGSAHLRTNRISLRLGSFTPDLQRMRLNEACRSLL